MKIDKIIDNIESDENFDKRKSKFIQLMKYYLENDPKRDVRNIDFSAINGVDIVYESRMGDKTLVKCNPDGQKGLTSKKIIDFSTIAKNNNYKEVILANMDESFTKFFISLSNIDSASRPENITYIDKNVIFKSEFDNIINWDNFEFKDNFSENDIIVHNIVNDKKDLWGHQKHAVINVLSGFELNDRGKLIMACGAGKTITCLKIAENLITLNDKQKSILNNIRGDEDENLMIKQYDDNFSREGNFLGHKNILVVVPSISLLRQTLNSWAQHKSHDFSYAVICSDEKAADIENDQEGALLDISATTKPETVAEFLSKCSDNTLTKSNLNVVFSTYHSLHVLNKAQKLVKSHSFDLTICDESHKTAIYEKDSMGTAQSFGNIHKPGFIRSDKTLFMTATPKVYAPNTKEEYEKTNKLIASMDDEKKFGETFYELTFSQAVKKGILADYKNYY